MHTCENLRNKCIKISHVPCEVQIEALLFLCPQVFSALLNYVLGTMSIANRLLCGLRDLFTVTSLLEGHKMQRRLMLP